MNGMISLWNFNSKALLQYHIQKGLLVCKSHKQPS